MDFTKPQHLQKIIENEANKFMKWKNECYSELLTSWISYISAVKSINFNVYCIDVYNHTLEDVEPKSYKKSFKPQEL